MLQLLVQVPVDLSRALVPGMRARGSGRLLQVASTASFQPCPGYALYAACKAALLSWSNALHHELRGTGVTYHPLPRPPATAFSRPRDTGRAAAARHDDERAPRAELGVRGMEARSSHGGRGAVQPAQSAPRHAAPAQLGHGDRGQHAAEPARRGLSSLGVRRPSAEQGWDADDHRRDQKQLHQPGERAQREAECTPSARLAPRASTALESSLGQAQLKHEAHQQEQPDRAAANRASRPTEQSSVVCQQGAAVGRQAPSHAERSPEGRGPGLENGRRASLGLRHHVLIIGWRRGQRKG